MGKIYIYLLYKRLRANSLNTIIGTYECKADEKGRLMVPAPLKKQLHAGLEKGFVLKRSVFQPCLELYPMEEWDKMMNKLNKLNRFVKKNNDFIRRFTAGVKMVEIDNAGRFLIPKDLLAFAGITPQKNEITLSSAVNIIEVWSREKYEAAIDETALDFADLAEDVMGSLNDDDGIS